MPGVKSPPPKPTGQPPSQYTAYLVRVIDGDTVIVDIYLGLDTWIRRRVRIAGVDCPEMNAHIPGNLARNECAAWWEALGGQATLVTEEKEDAHGRLLGDFAQNLSGRLVNRLSTYLLNRHCRPLG